MVNYRTRQRSKTITEEFIGEIIKIYNGKQYITIQITKNMVGHKLGEFALTKKLGSSIHQSEKNKKKKSKKK